MSELTESIFTSSCSEDDSDTDGSDDDSNKYFNLKISVRSGKVNRLSASHGPLARSKNQVSDQSSINNQLVTSENSSDPRKSSTLKHSKTHMET